MLTVIGVLTLALLAGLLPNTAYAVPPPQTQRNGVELEDLPEADEAPGDDDSQLAELTPTDSEPREDYEPVAVEPPAGGSVSQKLSGLAAGELVQVGDLPVEVGAPDGATDAEAKALEGTWQVELATPDAIEATAIQGMALTVTPPVAAEGDAVIALEYTEFTELYGADWADRLSFVQYPSCFLTDPEAEECSEPTEVATENVVEGGERRILATLDVAALAAGGASGDGEDAVRAAATTTDAATATDAVFRGSPSAAYPWSTPDTAEDETGLRTLLPVAAKTARTAAAAGSGSSVLLATDSGSGSKGDFSATPLVAAGSWSAGSGAGGFGYTYPLNVPEVPGGPSPSVAFGYHSQVVDGRTSASNNQPSWVGDGWEYNAGSITRAYRSCRDDTKDGNNAKHKTADMCWGSYNATLTLGGTTTELVLDDKSGEWVTSSGDGSRVELLKDTKLGNGDDDGEYWRVTTRDGTQYYFGLHKLPGWSSGKPVTDSVFTVPVSGNQKDEPCYNAKFADSFCQQAWRWNLDYVVDTSGNAMTLWWEKETNHYARDNAYKKPVPYVRGGYLSRIDYGQRADSLFSAGPIARVSFAVDERCFAEGQLTCTEKNFTSGNFGQNRIWYDTPADLYCSGASGKECYVPTPTFWSRKRLAKVTTLAQRAKGSTELSKVDSWTLSQTLPADHTDVGTALWLSAVTRTGYDTDGEAIVLNPVSFLANSEPMPNRVKKGAKDTNPAFDRLRVSRIVSEYGGETRVVYKAPEGACASGSGFPKPEANTTRCFPAYWNPDPERETIEWFNKYVVDFVEEMPALTGVPSTTTAYEYLDGGAWALNQAEFSKKKTRTYDQWRGFARVRTLTGENSRSTYRETERGKSEVRYFRGMDGDPLPDGTKRAVTVKDTTGATIAKDSEPFQGRVAESVTYTSAAAADWLTRSVDRPEAVQLASRARDDGKPALKAWRVQDVESLDTTKSSGGGDDKRTERTLRTTTEYDATYGLPVRIDEYNDYATGSADNPDDDTCTTLSYVHNTAKHLIGLSKESLTFTGLCADAAKTTGADWISGARVAYDDKAYGEAPTAGLATTTWDVSGSGGSWTRAGGARYDSYGRVVSSTDAKEQTSTVTYVPDSGQVHQVTTSNPLKHTATSVVEPGRGTALSETDANGRTTVFSYDALGRSLAGWSAGQDKKDLPSVRFTYNTTVGEPVSVVTETLGEDDTYHQSVVIYDGLGRERQTQTPAVGGGRLISDVLYSANGTVKQTNNAFYSNGGPTTQLFSLASDHQVPNSTFYAYDGLGRVLSETPYEAGRAKPDKAVSYEYGADYTTVTEPEGSASTRTYSDALGRTVRIDTLTGTGPRAYFSTRYDYDARGDQIAARDSEENTWSWTYDARGRLTEAADPDTGRTKTWYDELNRPYAVENALGVKVWTGYDELSRPTGQRIDDSNGTELTRFGYDPAGAKGYPASAIRFTDGKPYTTTITGYNTDYQPTGQRLTLPKDIASGFGLKETYAYGYEYSKTGLAEAVTLPSAGALGSERVVVRYNDAGLPISTSGKDWYTAETSYSPYGEVLRTTTGSQPYRVWNTNLFDESSGQLTRTITDRENTGDTSVAAGNRVNSRTYGYDNSGNMTTVADRLDGVTDRQCFRYDTQGQLTEAWTTPNADSCVAKGQTTAEPKYADGTVNVTAANSGYWQSYTYDTMGNRTRLVAHHPGLDTAKDATTEYRYGRTGAAPDAAQPHTLTSMASTYTTDAGAKVHEGAALTYDAAGNTEKQVIGGDEQGLTWTWDGKVEKVTGFGANGAGPWVGPGKKCIDARGGAIAAGTAIQLYACNGTKAQKYRVDAQSSSEPGTGALKVMGKCVIPAGNATANGTLTVLAECTGAANQKWTATATGALKHVVSERCLDVPGGSTASSVQLQISTCAGSAGQSWAPADVTSYIYDAGGERLLAVSGGEHTLYLGDTTVATDAVGEHAYTERYYSQPGAPTVMRRVQLTGSNEGQLYALVTDHHGTPMAEISLVSGQSVKLSKSDPFGVERSEASTWLSHRGFVGGDRDSGTGLTHLGAREYNPHTGRFLSADPVLDQSDPVQMNGYNYANNSPMTFSDPSGLAPAGGGEGVGGPSASQQSWARAALNRSLTDVILSTGWAVLKEFLGWNDVVSCVTRGDLWACASVAIDAIPWSSVFSKSKKIWNALNATMSAISAWRSAQAKARQIIELARKAAEAAKRLKAAKEKALKAAQAKKAKAAAAAQALRAKVARAKAPTGKPVQKQARVNLTKSSGGGGGAARTASPARTNSATRTNSPSSGGTGSAGHGESPKSGCNSFVPGTLVLMADGTTKPIEDVRNGDKVLATDPVTGETSVETVSAEITGQGQKNLVEVTIAAEGDAEAGKGPTEAPTEATSTTSTVTATDGHPFWVPALNAWIKATDLKAGQWLRTSAGTHVQITAIKRWTATAETVHNLTVTDKHTYYVLAGATPVLVHNCGGAQDLADRASEIHGQAGSEIAMSKSTVAVVSAQTPKGVVHVVAGSGRGLNKAQKDMLSGVEFPARNIPGTHAEQNALLFINEMRWSPIAGGASRSVCSEVCAPLIRAGDGRISGRVYQNESGTKIRTYEW
ncbi:ricin-type beta-trefoil lectin domain protein [Streptomyces corynorhini]|uniref:Sugar-binding protein n=1 Tax=Streptomyces corynorhini TaxID=2282652 RepID=A0A370B712_9ACTN|nr:ricin-type beta-trefoil lectin domain protein [Streptomyces corynorhini]RDG37598.1 sugar-binding protein [Streptomyces corynorhini]